MNEMVLCTCRRPAGIDLRNLFLDRRETD